MEELIPRNEAIPHILHYGQADPNQLIYNWYVSTGQTDRAERFLNYRATWEAVRQGTAETGFPPHVAIALNNACNLRCAHCYRTISGNLQRKEQLCFSDVKRVIDECREIGVHSIGLGTESEMYLYEHIDELIEYVNVKSFDDFWICTNGTLLNEQRVQALLRGGVTRLSISIDAVSCDLYRKVRGGNYYRLIENIFNFLEQREKLGSRLPLLRVTMIRSNLTSDEVEAFIGFWSKIADEVDIQPLIDVKNIDILKHTSIDNPSCRYPWSMLYINWNGDIKPCCSEFNKHLTVGNIADMSVKEAWDSNFMRQLCQEFVEKRINRYCLNCLKSLNSDECY